MKVKEVKRLISLLQELCLKTEALEKAATEHCRWREAGRFSRMRSTTGELKRDLQYELEAKSLQIIDNLVPFNK